MRRITTLKLMSLVLVLAHLLTAAVGFAESSTGVFIDDDNTIQAGVNLNTLGIQRGTELVIGTPIAMKGDFGTDLWGNNASDLDVRALLHGYDTVYQSQEGFHINPTVVTHMSQKQMDDGTVIYTLQLADNLRYNNGTLITAHDFAFFFLLSCAPEIQQIGGTIQSMNYIVGCHAYEMGESNVLEGIRILSDYKLEIRATAESFPYFYDLARLSARPLPISEIAPGCVVVDDGEGVYILGDFTVELLARTLLNPKTGYQYFPKVTSGAYMLESFDSITNRARFVMNAHYLGDYNQHKPHIERLVLRHVGEETMLELLAVGDVGLLNKVTDSTASGRLERMVSEHNQQLTGQDQPTYLKQATYPRTGFGYLAFACEAAPTDSLAVRRAIAMGFDKDAFVQQVMLGSAQRTYGYYGNGQWMANYDDDDEATLPMNVAQQLRALDVPMNVQGAIALLEADGWTLNTKGETFVSGNDTVRYRQRDGVLEPLTIRLALTKYNEVASQMLNVLERALPKLGIELQATEMPFPQLLKHYYRQEERGYDMFFMASNFDIVFDPYFDFHVDDAFQGVVNTSGLVDWGLMGLAQDLRETEPQDMRGYVEKWLVFQQKFVELMPMVPIYSNLYYDFHTSTLQNYNIAEHQSWAYAIIDAYMTQTPGGNQP